MVGPVLLKPWKIDGWQSGRVGDTAAHQVEEAAAATAPELEAFRQSVKEHNDAAADLKAKLESSPDEAVSSWAQSIALLCTDEIPEALKKPLEKLEWSELELPDPHQPIQTKWQPLPPQRRLPIRPALKAGCQQ